MKPSQFIVASSIAAMVGANEQLSGLQGTTVVLPETTVHHQHHGIQPRDNSAGATEDGHSHHFQNEDPFTTTYHTAPVTQADPSFVFKTGHSFYSDPGLDLSWHPLSQSSPIDIAITVAVSLFGLSLLLQVISKVSDLFSSRSVVETMRSISEGRAGGGGVDADPETLARITNSVYKAYTFYQEAAASQANQEQDQGKEDLTAKE